MTETQQKLSHSAKINSTKSKRRAKEYKTLKKQYSEALKSDIQKYISSIYQTKTQEA